MPVYTHARVLIPYCFAGFSCGTAALMILVLRTVKFDQQATVPTAVCYTRARKVLRRAWIGRSLGINVALVVHFNVPAFTNAPDFTNAAAARPDTMQVDRHCLPYNSSSRFRRKDGTYAAVSSTFVTVRKLPF